MLASIAFALLLANQEDTAAPPAPAEPVAATNAEDVEICRRLTVQAPSYPAGRKTSKVCKTKEEWKDYARRNNN